MDVSLPSQVSGQGMVRNMRRGHDGAFKAKAALESIKGEKTPAQLSSEFGVHANQIGQWREQLLKELLTMERLHKPLGYRTPYEIYVRERVTINPMQASTIHDIYSCFCLDNGE